MLQLAVLSSRNGTVLGFMQTASWITDPHMYMVMPGLTDALKLFRSKSPFIC